MSEAYKYLKFDQRDGLVGVALLAYASTTLGYSIVFK